MFNRFRIASILSLSVLVLAIAIVTMAQTAPGPVMRVTATTINVSGAPDPIRIDVLAWSNDADRDTLLNAWNLTAAPATAGRGGAGGGRGGAGGGAGAGGGRGARGGDAAAGNAAPEAGAAGGAATGGAGAGGGRGGRGGGGGRGGAGGGAAADAPRQTPEGSLAAALQAAKTVGYVWSSESAGYSLRYAYRLQQPDGSERIIFATDRRLGAWNNLWKPTGTAAPNEYDFSVIELHLNAKGEGEGKASVTGKVAVDSAAKSIALDGYSTLPIVLKDVKRKAN